MNKFETAAEDIADRVWVVMEKELENEAITEMQLRRVFTQTLADALAEILVHDFLSDRRVRALCAAPACACEGISPGVLPTDASTPTE